MSNEKMREEFEAWVQLEFPGEQLGRFNTGEYQGHTLQFCWIAWQASRAAVPDMNAARTTMRQVLPEVPGDLLDHALFNAFEAAGLQVKS